MLSSVFTKAVQWGIVEDNPVKRAEPPKGEAVEVSYLEEADAARLLAALHDVPPQYSAMVQLGLFTGMRRGEICGLRWSDIDFNASTISVNRTVEYIPHEGLIFTAPKTKASNRTFKVGANCMDMLREYQLYHKRRNGCALGRCGRVLCRWRTERRCKTICCLPAGTEHPLIWKD